MTRVWCRGDGRVWLKGVVKISESSNGAVARLSVFSALPVC